MTTSFVRTATFLLPDLFRGRASFAKEKAKQMQGAGNPLTGASIRQPASTYCAGCGRWHRPGNVCPAAMKSQGLELLVVKGDRAVPEADTSARVDCEDALGLLAQAGEPVDSDLCDQDMPQPPQPPPSMQFDHAEPERADMPPHLASESMLMWAEEPEDPKTHDELADDFKGGSQHLQGQEAAYLTKLRAWQARYGG